jgi:hypothetical protein
MAETLQTGLPHPTSYLVRAVEVAHETAVRQSPNGLRFATYGETGVADLDLHRMLEAVPTAITAALNANTYYFVPLALREANESLDETVPGDAVQVRRGDTSVTTDAAEPAMVASAYTDEFSNAAICHRNVELGQGRRGVFISTRLMGDRFALSFEFFINVAHAFADKAGVPGSFSDLVWKQALSKVRGETSVDAWEARNLAFGRAADAQPEFLQSSSRRRKPAASFSAKQRTFTSTASNQGNASGFTANLVDVSAAGEKAADAGVGIDEKERGLFLEAAFSDAVAIYLLSLALDFDYSELREREYPLLAPTALAARLRVVAGLFPPNAGYEFAVRYRRRG